MTDEELKNIAKKIGPAISLENPKVEYICFLSCGKYPKGKMLQTMTTHATEESMIAAIIALKGMLEDRGFDMKGMLAAIARDESKPHRREEF